MSDSFDFERYWLRKLSDRLDETTGEEIRQQVMSGSEALSDQTDRAEIIDWSIKAMNQLEALASEESCKQVMTGCACHYPKDDLQDAREAYAQTGDIDAVLDILQGKFEAFLRDTLELESAAVDEIVGLGWGLAGRREDNVITATKIPKSGYLKEYMNHDDPVKRREVYCHCPRVRDALRLGAALPSIYCYCGAGYYKALWEEILQKPVSVEVLESVLSGGDVCTVAVHLP